MSETGEQVILEYLKRIELLLRVVARQPAIDLDKEKVKQIWAVKERFEQLLKERELLHGPCPENVREYLWRDLRRKCRGLRECALLPEVWQNADGRVHLFGYGQFIDPYLSRARLDPPMAGRRSKVSRDYRAWMRRRKRSRLKKGEEVSGRWALL